MAGGASGLGPFVPKIMLIVGSVRPIPGRKGIAVANWVRERLSAVDGVEIDFTDLLEVGLPFYDELLPAALGQFFAGLVIVLGVLVPWLIPLAVIGAIVWISIAASRSRRRRREAAAVPPPSATEPPPDAPIEAP